MRTVFEIGHGERSKESKGSFRIVAIGPLLPPTDRASGDAATKRSQPLRRGDLDGAMASMAPALFVEVADPRAVSGRPLRLELRFSKVGDFGPAALGRVPEIAALRTAPPVRTAAPVAAPAPAPPASEKSIIDMILDAGPARSTASTGASTGSPQSSVFATLLQGVTGHSDVRTLEAAWRGLKLLVDRMPDGVTVEAFAAQPDEVEGVLAGLARAAGQPVDLIVVDHEVTASSHYLALLSAWAGRACEIGAPLVVNASPVVLGFDDVASLGKTRRRVRSADDPRAQALCSVAAREETRWVALAMNRPLARARITRDDEPFEEPEELLAGAAYAVALLAAKSFGRTGWGCQMTGPIHGLIDDLPVGSPTAEDQVAIATEALVRDDAAKEAAGAGVCVLVPAQNRDVAILPYAPTLYRGPIGPSGTSGPAEGTIADQLFLARISWAVTELAAAIPKGTPEAAAKQVAQLTLAGLFAGATHAPELTIGLAADGERDGQRLELTVRPRGFLGVALEEATLSARLG